MNKTCGRAALIGILIFIFLVGAFSYMDYSRHQSFKEFKEKEVS